MAVLELEPGDAVLEEQGDDAEVEVGPDAADGAGGEGGGGDGGVVVQTELARVVGAGDGVGEGAGGEAVGGLEGAHEGRGDGFEGIEGGFEGGAEARELGGWGPAVRVVGVGRGAEVEVFLFLGRLVRRERGRRRGKGILPYPCVAEVFCHLGFQQAFAV